MIPAKLADLIASLAENLEVHMKALDPEDEEYGAYLKLAKKNRTIASQLEIVAAEMAGYRDLPMGRHDEQAMSTPEVGEAFARFVKVEKDLKELLEKRVEQDQTMLAEMSSAGA